MQVKLEQDSKKKAEKAESGEVGPDREGTDQDRPRSSRVENMTLFAHKTLVAALVIEWSIAK